jgi:hypothetical protein
MNKKTVANIQDVLNDIDLNLERIESLNNIIGLTTEDLDDYENQNKLYSLVYANNLLLKETNEKMNIIHHTLLSIKAKEK